MTGMPIKRRTFCTANQKLPTIQTGTGEEEQHLKMKSLVRKKSMIALTLV